MRLSFAGMVALCVGAAACGSASGTKDTSASSDADSAGSPAPTGSLSVQRSGEGTVASEPPLIDCGSRCIASFSRRGPVTLTATPASGSRFVGWGGACQGTTSCTVDLEAADVAVSAFFEAEGPTPQSCADAMPASVRAPVVFDAGPGRVIDAISDATGEGFLVTVGSGTGPADGSRDYHFVRIRDGLATELAVHSVPDPSAVPPASTGPTAVSQPSGFDLFRYENGRPIFDVYSSDGTLMRTVQAIPPLASGEKSDSWEYSVVPGGGLAILRYVWAETGLYALRYSRFDAEGLPVAAEVPWDRDGFVVTWNVAASGNVLVVTANDMPFTNGPIQGRWFSADGGPLSGWFSAGDAYIKNFGLLRTPSSLVLNESGYYQVEFPDSQPTSSRAAAWLFARPYVDFEAVRGGFVRGLYPPDFGPDVDPCGASREVLTRDGVSCGCVPLPDVGNAAPGPIRRLGRDGSLFLERFTTDGHAIVEIYPGLFR